MPLSSIMKTRGILYALLVFALTGCNKTHTPPPIPEKDTTSLASQLLSARAVLTHSRDTTIHAPDTASTFSTTDTIHSIIRTEHAKPGTTLVGRWYFLKTGQKIAENNTVLNSGSNISHFDIMNGKPWPQGQYKLIILADSAAKDSATFTVVNMK